MAIAVQLAILQGQLTSGGKGWEFKKLSGTHQLFVECGVKVLNENIKNKKHGNSELCSI
jgi:hypothetical protein